LAGTLPVLASGDEMRPVAALAAGPKLEQREGLGALLDLPAGAWRLDRRWRFTPPRGRPMEWDEERLGWVALLLARRSRGYQLSLLFLGVTLAVTPGPIIGFGLKELIQQLVGWEQTAFQQLGVSPEFPPLRSMLYDQPSPIPGAWASAVRFFPLAMLLAAAALRTIPEELWELSAQSGFGIWKRWRILIYPLTGGMASRSVLLISALTLGEVSASKLVNPPFYSNAILRLFDQMHYGADSTVAALCLLQMASSLLLAGLWLVLTLESDPLNTSA
jgi:iron(III) transport system permease protein